MINKYLHRSLSRKNENEIIIWSWNNLEAMVGSMVSYWWDSASQKNAAELLGVMVFSSVVGVDSRMGNSVKAMLGERWLVRCVSVRIIEGDMDVSR